jgi:hypothetical protein
MLTLVLSRLTKLMDQYLRGRGFRLGLLRRLSVFVPLAAALGLMALLETMGLPRGSPVADAVLLFGFVASAFVGGLWLYRWFVGYGSTAWQQEQTARERREREQRGRRRL